MGPASRLCPHDRVQASVTPGHRWGHRVSEGLPPAPPAQEELAWKTWKPMGWHWVSWQC